jgi:general secretion pathway protein B
VSLILDALRKADAERERGSVPSLHSQPVLSPSVDAAPKSRTRPNWLWIAIGVVLGLVASAILVKVGRDASAPSATTLNPPPAQTVTPVAVSPEPAPASGASRPAAAPANAGIVAEPAPWVQPAERKVPRAAEAKGDTQVTTLGNVPQAEAPVYAREQLPPDIRSALPQIAIGGSMYSPDPTGRSLIINGRLYREGSRLTQELSLEEIKLRAAIFSFRGYRFEVVF